MAKKTLLMILVLLLLASCISITVDSQTPTPGHNFVTATLALTKDGLHPTVSPIPPEATTPAMTVPANCTNTAVLLRDVTIPDNTRVTAGEKITKTWEFQNTGTCPWVDYTLEFASGDEIGAPHSVPMPVTAPNEKTQVSMELTAPSANGTYHSYFTLRDSKGVTIPIGTETTFWVKFMVGSPVAISTVASATYPTPSGNCTHSLNANYVNEIVSLINSARADAGVPALTFNTQLAAFAQSHAEDMAFNNFLSHDGSNATFSERMMAYGIFAEILAIGTPQNAMEQWRRDEHWDFVLSPNTQIGVGYAYNSCSDYGGYFTVDFQ
jgi:uncharacterized protein YkwD